MLLNAHANVNAQDANGITPIHLAAYRDNVVGVQKLLQAENIDIHVSACAKTMSERRTTPSASKITNCQKTHMAGLC